MPHVTVYYEMFLPGGHHRQPRNTSISLDLAPTSGADVAGVYSPPFFPQLPYTLNNGNGMAKLIFWSVTDGTNGQVLPPMAFNQTVGSLPLTITAWYFPISGPGVGGNGSAIIDDAFSANLGRFIDDTFVDVTSDSTLTNDANVIGVVPTTKDETLVAKNSVASTTEPFSKWILNDSIMPIGVATLQVEKGTNGIAIAIYQESPHKRFPRPPYEAAYNPWWWFETHGGRLPPGPSDPWIREFAAVMMLADTASEVSPQIRARVLETILKQMSIVTATIEKEIKTLQR